MVRALRLDQKTGQLKYGSIKVDVKWLELGDKRDEKLDKCSLKLEYPIISLFSLTLLPFP